MSTAPPFGHDLAAKDVQEFVKFLMETPDHPHAKDSIEFMMSIRLSQKERLKQWQLLKTTMGAEEFARIGYCEECANEANMAFRKDIATKCVRHSE